jgi:hypothetical protein
MPASNSVKSLTGNLQNINPEPFAITNRQSDIRNRYLTNISPKQMRVGDKLIRNRSKYLTSMSRVSHNSRPAGQNSNLELLKYKSRAVARPRTQCGFASRIQAHSVTATRAWPVCYTTLSSAVSITAKLKYKIF